MRALRWVLLGAVLSACGARTALRVPDGAAALDAGDALDALEESDAGDARDASDASDVVPECVTRPALCDDGDACTVDRCDPRLGCVREALRCDDGDACTIDLCDRARGCFTAPRSCDDGDACTVERCDPRSGCVRAPLVCRDDDPCTADRCDPRVGCVFPGIECGGCADGSRDGFLDRGRYPDIAACAGGFVNPGLNREAAPTCARGAGDDGPNPSGRGCNAADLCAAGFHVCRTEAEVRARSVDGCRGASDAPPDSFFATRQTGPGCLHCATGADATCGPNDCRAGCLQTARTSNDLFGCGSLGAVPVAASCGVLDRSSQNRCSALRSPWRCDQDPDGLRESEVVVKPGPEAGGVLCCRD